MNLENLSIPSYLAICDCGDYLYASCFVWNALVRIDKKTFDSTYLGRFPGEEGNATSLHRKAIRHKDKIYFIPQIANGIGFYDLETGEIGQLPIPVDWEKTHEKVWCADAFVENDRLILFPRWMEQPLLIYDTINKIFIQEKRWQENLRKYCEWDQMFDTRSICISEECYWVVGAKTNNVFCISKDTFSVKRYLVEGDYKLRNITSNGSYFWLSVFEEDCILRWNITTNEVVVYKDSIRKGIKYHRVLFWKNRGYVLSASGTEIVEIDFSNNGIKHTFEVPEIVRRLNEKVCAYGEVIAWDNGFMFLPCGTRYLLLVDVEHNVLQCKELLLPEIVKGERIKKLMGKYGAPLFFQETLPDSEQIYTKSNPQKICMGMKDYLALVGADYLKSAHEI